MPLARILVVDDTRISRAALARTLKPADVVAVADGDAALACVRDVAFHLVISDVQMDEMDGFALAAALAVRAPGLPVALVTGGLVEDALHIVATRALDNVVAVLPKPVSRDALNAVMARATGRAIADRRVRPTSRGYAADESVGRERER